MMDEIYLVTGAAGHLGSAVVRELLGMSKRVRALVLPREKNLPFGDVEICYGNVCDSKSLDGFFQHKENEKLYVIHCAGVVSIASRFIQNVYDVNVTGTKNVVDWCERCKVNRLVYVSSVHAIPEKPVGEDVVETRVFHPDEVTGIYAKTKSEATAHVLAAASRGLSLCVVHPTGICGPFDQGSGHMTTLVLDYVKGRLVASMKGGYDFVDVRDVATGIISCLTKGRSGECYILSNRYFEIKEILDMLHDITGKRKIRLILPLWFVRLTASLSETYYRILQQPPLYTPYSIYTISSAAHFSNQKARAELDYCTRDMRVTLGDTVAWLENEGRL